MTTVERNTGHGPVRPRPDGVRARCGGPALCSTCRAEALTVGPLAGLLGPGGALIELPVRLTVGEGEPVEIGRLDVTIGISVTADNLAEADGLLCTVTPADGATVNTRLADLLDHAAAQLRAGGDEHDPAGEVPDAAAR